MAHGMLDVLQPRLPLARGKSEDSGECRWIKVCDMRDDSWSVACHSVGVSSGMEVRGTKASLRVEKMIEREFVVRVACEIIQRNARYVCL